VLAGIPVLVWPVFGDQESVAETAGKLGIGVPNGVAKRHVDDEWENRPTAWAQRTSATPPKPG
jgi:UDP:flavonoid glycosyltransferase YjiC (YdhE family)